MNNILNRFGDFPPFIPLFSKRGASKRRGVYSPLFKEGCLEEAGCFSQFLILHSIQPPFVFGPWACRRVEGPKDRTTAKPTVPELVEGQPRRGTGGYMNPQGNVKAQITNFKSMTNAWMSNAEDLLPFGHLDFGFHLSKIRRAICHLDFDIPSRDNMN